MCVYVRVYVLMYACVRVHPYAHVTMPFNTIPDKFQPLSFIDEMKQEIVSSWL